MNSEFGVGSIAGGGRYDQLIMKLNNSKTQTPAIGVSIGIERVISILEKKIGSTIPTACTCRTSRKLKDIQPCDRALEIMQATMG